MLGYYNYYKLVTLSRILSLTQLYKFHKHLRTEAAFVGGLTDGLHVPRDAGFMQPSTTTPQPS